MNNRDWQSRLAVVFAVTGIAFAGLILKLFDQSIIGHPEAVQAADSQSTFRENTTGVRGDIDVSVGNGLFPLATNEQMDSVSIIPSQVTNARATADQVAGPLGIDKTALFNEINNSKPYLPPIKKHVPQPIADKIAALNLNGVILQPESDRTYPEGQLASQVLGFVNDAGAGNYGVEQEFDDQLKGTTGYESGVKDSTGQPIALSQREVAKNGDTFVLTLDRDIQYYAESALADAVKNYKADSGSVVIVEPKTGKILAMASVPTFDPNAFRDVPQDKQSVFNNPIVSSEWEPGSIMKTLVLAMAIDKGLLEPDTASDFAASVKVGVNTIWTAERKAFGHETMTQVLENSDNVGMVWVSDKMGNEMLYNGLKAYGFGEKTGVSLPNEDSGSIPPLKDWQDITRATASFGQGVAVTPLQMVMAYAAVANEGKLMAPQIVQDVIHDDGTKTTMKPRVVRQIMSPETAGKAVQMAEAVVTNGLAKAAGVPGYNVGGKTGTAQVPDPEGGYYPDKTIGALAGFFPASNPQYAMIVKIDNPKTVHYAESSAAPTFGKIAAWILQEKQVPPDKTQ